MRFTARTAFLAATAAAAVLASAPRALANEEMKADVPFKFVAEGKTYNPGKYDIQLITRGEVVELQGTGRNAGVVPVITRLDSTSSSKPHLVFDRIGNTYYLSELWEDGHDGFLVYAAKGSGPHRVVHLWSHHRDR